MAELEPRTRCGIDTVEIGRVERLIDQRNSLAKVGLDVH